MALTTTAKLVAYTPNNYPIIGNGQARFITDELGRISATLSQLVTALQAIEARIALGGL